MRFTIAKPSDKMSHGSVFYSLPNDEAENQAMGKLEAICSEKADNRYAERIEKELEAIKMTSSAMSVMIMYEIAALSKELGYPTALFGMESGMYIMELLGISNVQAADFENDKTPSELAVTDMIFGKGVVFTLAIAEPVREHIQRRLNERFGEIDGNNELYRSIDLPRWDMLEQIGNLSVETGVTYNKVDYRSPDILKDLFDDICKNDLKQNTYLKHGYIPMELARLYAFARCTHTDEVLFSDVRNYVLREDIYRVVRDKGCVAPEALRFSRNWSRGRKKEIDIELLEQYDLPENLFYCYKNLNNLWSAAPCLARTNAMATLMYYKQLDEALYHQIVKE